MPQIHLAELRDVAVLEELRQATGLSEIADGYERLAGGVVARGAPGMWINNAVGLGLCGPVSREEVDRFAAYHEAAGAEPRIELCPFVDPSLTRHLGEAGFRVASSGALAGFESVLFRPLSAEETVRPIGEPPRELELRAVDAENEPAAREYATVACSGFFERGEPIPPEATDVAMRCLRHPRTVGVAAYMDGRVVGAGAMEVAGEIAALFGLSVLPEYRRRGIQQALIAHRLNIAARRGARIATIGARPGIPTERNARRMGFELAYTKVILVRPGPGLAPVIG